MTPSGLIIQDHPQYIITSLVMIASFFFFYSICKLIQKQNTKYDFKYNVKSAASSEGDTEQCLYYMTHNLYFIRFLKAAINHKLYSSVSCACMHRCNAVPLKLSDSFRSILLPVITSPYQSSLHVTLPVLCLVNVILWPLPPCAFSTYLWRHISPSNC